MLNFYPRWLFTRLILPRTLIFSLLWAALSWPPSFAQNTDTGSGTATAQTHNTAERNSTHASPNSAQAESSTEEPVDGKAISANQLHREVLSESGKFRVELVPLNNTIPLLELHDWTARVYDLQSKRYVFPDHISLSGGMKAHGHGLPTTPRLAGRKGDSYLVSGVRFNMRGKWHLLIKFIHLGQLDSALFELEFASDTMLAENHSATAGAKTDDAAFSIQWTPGEIAQLKSLSLISGNLQSNTTGNAYGTDRAAVTLGHRLFFDKNLSRDAQHACSSCHHPATYFNDQKTTATGLSELSRNTPTLVGAGLHRWLYWDGRRDSLWSQALVPLEAPAEMGSSRVAVARRVAQHYRTDYESIFGPLPVLPGPADLTSLANPTAGDEGRELWNAIDVETRHHINTVFTNVGKALAAYEMKLMPAPSRFDHYVEQLLYPDQQQSANNAKQHHSSHGDKHSMSKNTPANLMSSAELKGMKLFISNRTQCMNCHASPMFSNFGFHNIGTGITADGAFDFGRMMGSQAVLINEFNCRSRYSDTDTKTASNNTQRGCAELKHLNLHGNHGTRGAFRVPGLRGLDKTAPYMHDGRYESLQQVISHYSEPPAYLLGQFHEMPGIEPPLQEEEIDAIAAFLLTLGSEIDADQRWLVAPEK